jgi:hypothetical protein
VEANTVDDPLALAVRLTIAAILSVLVTLMTLFLVSLQVRRRRLSPRVGALLLAGAMALLPWIAFASGALPFKPRAGLLASILFALPTALMGSRIFAADRE